MPSNQTHLAENIEASLMQLVNPLDAMYLAQLCAFAHAIPQLYFCREYLSLSEEEAKARCIVRLKTGISEQAFNIERLHQLISEREYFDADEARLRLAPEPDSFEDI